MMTLWEMSKTGRGQVVDLAQYEAVAQTQGDTLPRYTAEGVSYGHTGNKAPGFEPYDTFKCQAGWAFIGVLGPAMFPRVARLLGLDSEDFNFDTCSEGAAAVNSEKGLEIDRRLRKYCGQRSGLEVETVLNNAQIGCSRLFSVQDQYNDAHLPRPRDDRTRAGPPVRRSGPRLRRGPQAFPDTGADLARCAGDR